MMSSEQSEIKPHVISNIKPSIEDPFVNLEKEIEEVVSSCRSVIKNNGNLGKTKGKYKQKIASVSNINNDSVSKITLEKVAEDITQVLGNIKEHLSVFKNATDSFSDVGPELEKMLKTKSKINSRTVHESKTTKNHPVNKNTPVTAISVKSNPQNQNVVNASPAKNQSCSSKNVDRNNQLNNQKRPLSANKNNKIKIRRSPKNNNSSRSTVTESTSHNTSTKPRNNTPIPGSSSLFNRKSVKPNYAAVIANYDSLGLLREEVQKAKLENRTFTIRGSFPAVRRALLRRGWVEKIHLSYRDRINQELKKFQSYSVKDLVELVKHKDIGDICKKLIKSKLLANHQVDFYWSYNYEAFKECPDKVKLTKINRFRRDMFSYTSKQGLCEASKQSFWFNIPGLSKLNHPRTYSLKKNGESQEFIKDFNMTAAMSLLKWIQVNSLTRQCKIISPSGKIPLNIFDFAINECYKFIKKAKHEDIDSEIREAFGYEWNDFLENYYKLVHVGNHFKASRGVRELDLVRKAVYIIEKIKEHWPNLEMDGMMNIWILKPTNSSQGVGIHMCRTLKYVLNVVKNNPNTRYIIQKYIEKPLLIYNTKFDIRQWFLISSTTPLTIWIYKFCYLRFSSQTYNLRKLHESIHLTNNSVQCRYSKMMSRDLSLPTYNMWDSKQFINYLSDIGYPRAFQEIIYPGMKESIAVSILMHQDKIDRRKNCFELYGADFILTEDFKPWLLEINSNPALHASTPVTARMCPAVLEDVIKVVVDYEKSKTADTGGFELIYQGKLTPIQVKDLKAAGRSLTPGYFDKDNVSENKHCENDVPTNNQETDAANCIKKISQGMRKTLEDLMELVKNERQRRLNAINKGITTIFENKTTETQTLP